MGIFLIVLFLAIDIFLLIQFLRHKKKEKDEASPKEEVPSSDAVSQTETASSNDAASPSAVASSNDAASSNDTALPKEKVENPVENPNEELSVDNASTRSFVMSMRERGYNEDYLRINMGFFKVNNLMTKSLEYICLNKELQNVLCLFSERDAYFHKYAQCISREFDRYRIFKEINYCVTTEEEAIKHGKTKCLCCDYNSLDYYDRLEFEIKGREYIETTLVGSGNGAIQSFLENIVSIYEFQFISQNRVFFDFQAGTDKVAAIVLTHDLKDAGDDFFHFHPEIIRQIIGYVPAKTIKKHNLSEDELEGAYGILKDITVDDSNKYICNIYIFLDKKYDYGIEQYNQSLTSEADDGIEI